MTLIEMLVVIAIIGIILPALYMGIASLYETNSRTLARTMALSEATDLARDIVRDVRGAVYAENGSLPIVSIATSSLVLYADTDFDGKVERVRYTLSGTDVVKGVIEPTSTSTYPTGSETVQTVARRIINTSEGVPLFRYYSATSTEITATSQALNVRRVDVEVVGASSVSYATYHIQVGSSASIRNLKDSY